MSTLEKIKEQFGTYCLHLFTGLIAVMSLLILVNVYVYPPASMFVDKYGIPHFTSKVINPETGNLISVGELARHYVGK